MTSNVDYAQDQSLATRSGLIELFNHRRECALACRKALEHHNYSPGLTLKCKTLKGSCKEEVFENIECPTAPRPTVNNEI